MTTAPASLVPLLMEATSPGGEGAASVPAGSIEASFAVAMECATAEPDAADLLNDAEGDAGADAGEAGEQSKPSVASLDGLAAMIAPLVFAPPMVVAGDFSDVPIQAVAFAEGTSGEAAAESDQRPVAENVSNRRLVEEGAFAFDASSQPPVVAEPKSIPTLPTEIVPPAQSVDGSPEGGSTPRLNPVAEAIAATSNSADDSLSREPLGLALELNAGQETAAEPASSRDDRLRGTKDPRASRPAIVKETNAIVERSDSAALAERSSSAADMHSAAPEPENSADPAGTAGAQLGKEANESWKMELPADHHAVSARVRAEDSAEELTPAVTAKSLSKASDSAPARERGEQRLQFMIDDRSVSDSMRGQTQVERAPAGAGSQTTQAVERTVEAIATHAVQIRHQGSESLSMVVRPDDKTEVRVDLHLTDGQVEAQVFLNHGDRESFAGQWSDLKDRLQQQGVRLAPLEGAAAAAVSDQPQHFAQHRQSPMPREDAPVQSPVPTSRPSTTPTQTPARSILRGILECYA